MQKVKVYYGPYESFHTLSHKPEKLNGLKDHLQKLGFAVETIPVEFVDYCMLEMLGHEVFRCNIRNLMYNTPSDLDPVCQRAVKAVLKSSQMLLEASDYFWLWSLIEDQIFTRKHYAYYKAQWPFEYKSEKFATSRNCIQCCGILVQKKQ